MSIKLPGPLPDNLPDLVEYAIVRRLFKWKSNDAIRRAVKADKLVRVNIGSNTQSYRITAESIRSHHADMMELDATCKQFDISPGRMQAMRQAKKQRDAAPVPQMTVELNEREIIRQAHNLDQTPAPPQSVASPVSAPPQSDNEKLGAYYNARGAHKVMAYRALSWQQRNRIIESERR